MKPSQEYLNSIVKKLDLLRNADSSPNIEKYEHKSFDLINQIGITGKKYLDDKEKNSN